MNAINVFLIIFLCMNPNVSGDRAPSRLAKVNIPFRGTASGGVLILGGAFGRNTPFVSVNTSPGEPAELVLFRLAEAIASSENLFEWPRSTDSDSNNTIQFRVARLTEGNTLSLPGAPGKYFLAGTERGLAIPEPIESLSCSYNKERDEVVINWMNHPAEYDKIVLKLKWNHYDRGHGYTLAGTTTTYTIDRNETPVDVNDLDIWVIGFRNDTPSNATAIHLSGNIQEELFGIPFNNGTAPNWQAWSCGAALSREHITSRISEPITVAKGRRYNPIKTADAKPFKQALNLTSGGGTVGIWRKFLGLTPGHTYRLSARLNTFEMDPNNTGWSYSLLAVPDQPGVEKLTENQMAGLAALPDGKSGQQAGRLKILDSTEPTGGQYKQYSADIKLPEDSNSITVWLRLTGTREAEVGFDWIRLEDLDAK
jgi:hypothetical protein